MKYHLCRSYAELGVRPLSFAIGIWALASSWLCGNNEAEHDWCVAASDFEFRRQLWIALGIYAVAFTCWPLDRRDVSGFLTKLFPATVLGSGLGFLIAAVPAVLAAVLVTWSHAYPLANSRQTAALSCSPPKDPMNFSAASLRYPLYLGTWLCWLAFGLLLNLLGLAVLAVGITVLVYRLIRREGQQRAAHCGAALPPTLPTILSHATVTTVRPDWKRGLLGGAHLWVAALALVILALTLKESLFFAVLATALVIRMLCASGTKFWQRQLAPVIAAAILLRFSAFAQVMTAQYDNARTSTTAKEKILTPQNVRVERFGRLLSFEVDGDVYAQPLYLPNLEIVGKERHNVLFVATEHDSVYAFDANGNPPEPLWHISFIDSQEHITTVPPIDLRCPFIRPEVGITPTPVIDPKTATLYVVARTKENQRHFQRLHALDVRTGAEKFGGPVVIQAAVPTGSGGVETRIEFDPLRENPRAALLLVGGLVYIAWASACDVGPYHGWVMAYDGGTLEQKGVFNTSPDGDAGGIWQGDAGPAADKYGSVFVITGNGNFNAPQGGRSYGESVIKLGVENSRLVVRDYFTPFNFAKLNADDADLGSSGPLLLPDQRGPHAHLLLAAGKGNGPIYMIDRDRMGNYREGDNAHAAQTLPGAKDCFGAPAYWNKNVYYVCEGDSLKDFRLVRGHLSPRPIAQSSTKFSGAGVIPAVSAKGSTNGIVWLIETPSHFVKDGPAILRAFDAANVTRELYNSELNSGRDRAGTALRFSIPTVANGKVYVGAKREVDVYGLLPSNRKR